MMTATEVWIICGPYLLNCGKRLLRLGDVQQHGGEEATGAVGPTAGQEKYYGCIRNCALKSSNAYWEIEI